MLKIWITKRITDKIMGDWGYGYFEGDKAFDFMADIEDADDPKRLIAGAFDTVIKIDYIESDEGAAVIVAATYVDSQLHGTKYSEVDRDVPLDVDTFPDRHPDISFSDLQHGAIQALQRVIGHSSELNELWAENEEGYPVWRQGIEQLIERLDKLRSLVVSL